MMPIIIIQCNNSSTNNRLANITFDFAPTFVYDGYVNKFKVSMLEKAGFKTFHKWKSAEYENFVEQRNFNIIENYVIRGDFLPECVLVCKKSK